MSKFAQNIVLVLVGAALVELAVSGHYLRFVKPNQFWLLIAAGVTIVGAGLGSIFLARTKAEDGHEHHGHGNNAWILLLAIVGMVVVVPPALGSHTVLRADRKTIAQSSAIKYQSDDGTYPKLPSGTIAMTLNEFIIRAATDTGKAMTGRTIQLTGFVVHQGQTEIDLSRVTIVCCAADALPQSVHLLGGQLSSLPNDQWVNMTGTWLPSGGDDQDLPEFTVQRVEKISTPQDTYEY